MDITRSPGRFDEVRLAILRQHAQIAELLDELEAAADAVLTKGSDGGALQHALDALHVRFIKHLEYEEFHLGSVADLGEHVEQRRRMRGLVHDRDVFGDRRGLAREARAFVHVLRKELAEETARLRELG